MHAGIKLSLIALALSSVTPVAAQMTQVEVTVTNTGPTGGAWIMRPWVGLHDGKFTTFTVGQPAASGIQHIAEDGVTGDPANTLPPSNACTGVAAVYNAALPCQFTVFNDYANRGQQATLGNPTAPGGVLSTTFTVNPNDPNSQFLSYLVMVIPSNDAFFGSDSAHPIQLFKNGVFNGGNGPITIPVKFGDILDAGTEVNTESAADSAFLSQAIPGTGTHPDTNPVIHPHDPFGNTFLTGSNMFGGTLNSFPMMNYQGQISLISIQEVTPAISTVVNAASLTGGSVSPGEIVVMSGRSLGPATLTQATFPISGKLATTLAGGTVTVNGVAAPMLYTSATQVSFQIPYEVTGATTANFTMTNGTQSPLVYQAPLATSAPGLFTSDYSGKGQLVAINQDGTVNSAANPALRGTSVVVFATGEGLLTPAAQDGAIQNYIPRQPLIPVGINVAGVSASVMYAGATADDVAGVLEVEFVVPSTIPVGTASITLQSGTIATPVGTTIAIK